MGRVGVCGRVGVGGEGRKGGGGDVHRWGAPVCFAASTQNLWGFFARAIGGTRVAQPASYSNPLGYCVDSRVLGRLSPLCRADCRVSMG